MAKLIFLLSVLMFILGACQKETLYREGDYFFIRNKGADMPVWVRGAKSSQIFIIHLHGGPGGSSIEVAEQKVYLPLEKDYAMVYWDQRASGASQGKAEPNTINMPQFVEDLDQVITAIQQKYNNPTIFLHGHSWGGALGAAYLSTNDYQNKIKGWIELDGAHNFKGGLELSRTWAIDFANRQIAANKDVAYWQEALNWYQQNPIISTKPVLDKHCDEYLLKANGYIYDLNNPNLQKFQGGSFSTPAGDQNSGDYVQRYLEPELSKSYSSQMRNIQIPSLILWGRHDGIMPVGLAQEAYDSLGTSPANKSIVIFENSAHSPNMEEPDLFIAAVRNFIEMYK